MGRRHTFDPKALSNTMCHYYAEDGQNMTNQEYFPQIHIALVIVLNLVKLLGAMLDTPGTIEPVSFKCTKYVDIMHILQESLNGPILPLTPHKNRSIRRNNGQSNSI
jgi:hypothetical protein